MVFDSFQTLHKKTAGLLCRLRLHWGRFLLKDSPFSDKFS